MMTIERCRRIVFGIDHHGVSSDFGMNGTIKRICEHCATKPQFLEIKTSNLIRNGALLTPC